MITPEVRKRLSDDTSGLATYEFIANNIGHIDDHMLDLVKNIISVDRTGQFVASTARYLHAIGNEKYAECIDLLVKAAIVKDRDRAYLGGLAAALWGSDYAEHAEQLAASDDNFRRIFKRLYPVGM